MSKNAKRSDGIIKALEAFTELRLDKSYELILKSDKYKSYDKKISKLFNQIMDLLPEESKRLLIKLSDSYVDQMINRENIIYEQALKDGITLIKYLTDPRDLR